MNVSSAGPILHFCAIWNNSSSYGAYFFQNFYLNANNTGQTGTFAPGSLALGSTLPAYGLAPQT